jgi:hypothetical protein
MRIIDEIAAERQRQRDAEGWTDKHDDAHADGSLAQAAACYAASARDHAFASELMRLKPPRAGITYQDVMASMSKLPWPRSWSPEWDKREKHPPRRQLIIAAALCIAEVERIDRASGAGVEGARIDQSWTDDCPQNMAVVPVDCFGCEKPGCPNCDPIEERRACEGTANAEPRTDAGASEPPMPPPEHKAGAEAAEELYRAWVAHMSPCGDTGWAMRWEHMDDRARAPWTLMAKAARLIASSATGWRRSSEG